MLTKHFYVFNSRIATHVLFWVIYYIAFSLIWATEKGLAASFFLEFILLPIRMMAVYVTIYYLVPRFLIKRQYRKFAIGYVGLILVAAVFQRMFIHFFYEDLLIRNSAEGLFSLKQWFRAAVLINTTVILVLSFKIFQLYLIEREEKERKSPNYLELRADRRTHRVHINDILFVEGKGNYTIYHLSDKSKIMVYGSIKVALEKLPNNFVRVHKSYIINKNEIKSFDTNNVTINDQQIPRGKNVRDDVFFMN